MECLHKIQIEGLEFYLIKLEESLFLDFVFRPKIGRVETVRIDYFSSVDFDSKSDTEKTHEMWNSIVENDFYLNSGINTPHILNTLNHIKSICEANQLKIEFSNSSPHQKKRLVL